MDLTLQDNCRELLCELGLATSNPELEVVPLSGGVASDIARVQIVAQKYCVKFALPKLKVQADWYVPVQRNAAEYAWLKVVEKVAPGNSIKLHGHSSKLYGFVMEYLEGDDVYLWKQALLSEAADQNEAWKVGELLGRIHAASVDSEFDSQAFHNQDDFLAIRIEPYLHYTASVHSDLGSVIEPIAELLYASRRVLVHGDVSPKNIFFRGQAAIILDAECATMGDACFDPAFCLNHLVLKAIHLPHSQIQNLQSVMSFWQAYRSYVNWEPVSELERRICRLLPVLMLARIDGKSPVEYLSEFDRDRVRKMARLLIKFPPHRLDQMICSIEESLKEVQK